MGNKKGMRAVALFLAALMLLGLLGPVVLRAFAAESSISDLQDKLYAAGGPLEVTDAAVQEYIDQHYGAENGSFCKESR